MAEDCKYLIERSNLYQVRKQASEYLCDLNNRVNTLEESPEGGISFEYLWDSDTATPVVATGHVKANNADISLVTQLSLSATTISGNDVSAFIATMRAGDTIALYEKVAPNGTAVFTLTGTPVSVVDYFTIEVTEAAIIGMQLPDANDNPVEVNMIQKRVKDHDDLENVTDDQHHNKMHSHDGIDGSGTVAHSDTTDQTTDDHHPQLHDLPSHTDITLVDLIRGEGIWWDEVDSQWKNRASTTEAWPTGLVSGGELNIVAGEIEVIAGLGAIVNSYTDPIAPSSVVGVEWITFQEPITAAPAVAGSIVWFTIFDTGVPTGSSAAEIIINVGALKQYAQAPPPTATRQEVPIGLAVHNGIEWQEVSSPDVINQSAETLREYVTVVNNPTTIISGGIAREIAVFSLEQDEGVVWENNRNWHVDKSDPNREALPARSPLIFQYVNRDFTDVGAPVSVVDPTEWDNGGIVEPVPNPANNSTIQRLYLDIADNFWILWGQTIYPTYVTAVASIGSDDTTVVVPQLLETAIFLGHIVSGKNVTAWGVGDAQFIPFGGSGSGVGGGGTPITDHFNLTNIGINTHVQIDSHIADVTTNPHDVTAADLGITGDLKNHWTLSGNNIYNNNSANVGIGTTSPEDKLDVAGNVIIGVTGVSDTPSQVTGMEVRGNTIADPPSIRLSNWYNGTWAVGDFLGAYEFYSKDGSGTGVGVRAAVRAVMEDTFGGQTGLALSTGGDIERMRITSTGNVGIGTTTPTQDIEIVRTGETASILVTSTDANQVQYNLRSDGIRRVVSRNNTSGVVDSQIQFIDQYMRFDTGGTSERMRIDSAGNVGIGTTAPKTALNVIGGNGVVTGNLLGQNYPLIVENNITCGISIQSGAANWSGINFQHGAEPERGIFHYAAAMVYRPDSFEYWGENHYFLNGAYEDVMTVLGTGNVGIGTDVPTHPLELRYPAGQANSRVIGFSTDDPAFPFKHYITSAFGVNDTFNAINFTVTPNAFQQTQPIVSITGDQRVGIGVNTPVSILSVLCPNDELSLQLSNNNFGSAIDKRGAGLGVSRGFTGAFMGLTFWTSNNATSAEVARFTPNGRFGIGITEPDAPLHVYGGNAIIEHDSNVVRLELKNSFTTAGNGNSISSTDDVLNILMLGFGKVRIQPNGDFAIGENLDAVSKLTVEGGVVVDVLTTDGDKGLGTINVSGNYYVNGVPISTFIDAPSDGTVYGRKDAAWFSLGTGAGTVSDLASAPTCTQVTITNTGGDNAIILAATQVLGGIMSCTDKTKLDGIAPDANDYTHPAYPPLSLNTSGAQVLDIFQSDAEGHVLASSSREMTLADLGYTGSPTANDYTHPAYNATNLTTTGAEVLAHFESDTIGSVQAISKRIMTAADIGAAAYTEGTFIPNFVGYVSGFVEGSNTYGDREGVWSRIGNLVTVEVKIEVTSTETDPNLAFAIAALPFTFSSEYQTGPVGAFLNALQPAEGQAAFTGLQGTNRMGVGYWFNRTESSIFNLASYDQVGNFRITLAGTITYRTNDP